MVLTVGITACVGAGHADLHWLLRQQSRASCPRFAPVESLVGTLGRFPLSAS